MQSGDFETHPVGTAKAYDLMLKTLKLFQGSGLMDLMPNGKIAVDKVVEAADETAASRSYR